MQLMQHSVQKSSRTMRPLRSAMRSGPALLIQAVPPSSSGAGVLSWEGCSAAGAKSSEAAPNGIRPLATTTAVVPATRTAITTNGHRQHHREPGDDVDMLLSRK